MNDECTKVEKLELMREDLDDLDGRLDDATKAVQLAAAHIFETGGDHADDDKIHAIYSPLKDLCYALDSTFNQYHAIYQQGRAEK